MKQVPYNDNALAVAYYRFSSQTGHQDTSNEQQAEAAQKYAEAHGLKIVKEYSDEGLTGTSDKRPGYRQLLAEIGELKVGALILWKVDRLSRDEYDVVIAKKIIRDAGTRIHYVAEATPDGSPESYLMEGILEKFAAYYSRQLAVNIRRGQDFNASKGLYLGVPILGYKKTGEGRHAMHYAVDETTAPIVQRIFREYVDGKAMADIARDLNREGRRTVRGGKFTTNSLRKTLKLRAYIGEYRYRDFVIEDGMPQIIDDDLFEAAQKRLSYNKTHYGYRGRGLDEEGKQRFWLTGKLYCGHCKESMQGTSGRSKTGVKYFYYKCNGARKGCKKKAVRKEKIEEIVIEKLTDFLKDPGNLASLAVDLADYYRKVYDDKGYLEGLKADLKKTENGLENLITAVMKGAGGETINRKLAEMEERKKQLRDAIDAETIKKAAIETEHSIREFFDRFAESDLHDPETRDMVLAYFVDRIYLYDDRLVIVATTDSHAAEGFHTDEVEVYLSSTSSAKSSEASPYAPGEGEVSNSPGILVGLGRFAIVYKMGSS